MKSYSSSWSPSCCGGHASLLCRSPDHRLLRCRVDASSTTAALEVIRFQGLRLRREAFTCAARTTTPLEPHPQRAATVIELTPEQIERARLENELARIRAHVAPFPTAEGIRAHKRWIEDLEARIRRMPPLPREHLK